MCRVVQITLAISLFVMTACGQGAFKLIERVSLSTYEKDQSAWIDFSGLLNLGKMSIGSIELPILSPEAWDIPLGVLSLHGVSPGKAELKVSLDFDRALKASGTEARLPNGSLLPVSSLPPQRIFGFAVGGIQARVYVGMDGEQAVVGAAIPIRELDGMGGNMGGASLFLPFFFEDGTRGVGGVFAGNASGQSGIALFVDGAKVLSSAPASAVRFRSGASSRTHERKILERIYQLNLKQRALAPF